jgi:hypothetical protein
MEMAIVLKAIFSLGLVFAVMYFCLKIIQKYTKIGAKMQEASKKGNLNIENIIYIDEGMKVVNLSNKEGMNYIIAVGKNNSFLIDKYKSDINSSD